MAPEDTWHPYFRALWEHCRAKPGAFEDHPWGDTVFKLGGKVFAFLGDPHGETQGVTVKPPADELDALLLATYIRRSKYIGRYGWISLTIEDDGVLQLALDLIDDSYERLATKQRKR